MAEAQDQVKGARGEAGARDTLPIRVLFIIDSLSNIGGAELCLLRLTRHLPQDQFECRVLTFNGGEHLRRQFDCPVDHWQVNTLGGPSALRMCRRLRRLVRDEQIDIVHTFFSTSDLLAGPVAKLSGAKVLISSRRDMGILRQRRHRFAYRLMRGIFDQVQTVSDGVRQWTIDADGVDPARAITIYNGVDTDVDVPADAVEKLRRVLNLGPTNIVVTTVANFRHVKGIDILVRAAVLAGKKAPGIRVFVAGAFGSTVEGRAYSAQVLEMTESLGAERWLRFLGQIDNVPALLELTDVFVLPSRSEGLSNALLEAMRAKLPCVVTSVGGNPEVVVDNETGYLIPPDDAEALADRILKLAHDPELRRRMGKAGHERVVQHFSAAKMTSNVIAAYLKVLNATGATIVSRGKGTSATKMNTVLGSLASVAGMNALLRHSLLRNQFLVLCYHGVLTRPPAYSPAYTINVLKSEFQEQMKFLASNFHLMPASELIEVLEGRQRLEPRSAVVTFDDGYRNNLIVAAPILEAYNIPAIFHISTAYIGENRLLWPDEVFLRIVHWPERQLPLPDGTVGDLARDGNARIAAAVRIQEECKRLENAERTAYIERLQNRGQLAHDAYTAEAYRFLDWDDVRELSRRGFEVGSHTVSHPILSRVNSEQLNEELYASKTRIEREINKECRLLAYPNGLLRDAGPAIWEAATAAGYRAGFTLRRGLASPKSPMAVDRINVTGNESKSVFEGRAAGVYVIR